MNTEPTENSLTSSDANKKPSETRVDGSSHDLKGRFAPGNKLGRGNPLAGRAAKIRAALLNAATDEDVASIADSLIKGAKAGDLAYIREWLDRVIGKPAQADLLERIERLEEMLLEREGAGKDQPQ